MITVLNEAIKSIDNLHSYCKKNRANKKALIDKLSQTKTYLKAALYKERNQPFLFEKGNQIVGLRLKDKFRAIENGFENLNLGELKWQENFYSDALFFAQQEGDTAKIAYNQQALELIIKQTQIAKIKLIQELNEVVNDQ